MKSIPPRGLRIIIGRWMIVSKQVAMAVCRLATGDSYYSIGRMFGLTAYISVKTSKRFVKSLLIVAIPLHLRWSACEELVNIKLGFWDIHSIL